MLKLIALFTMVLDHLGYVFFPEHEWLRWIGRLTMPIFAYAIARGFHYTRDRRRYLIQIAILALLSQGPYMLLFEQGWLLNMCVPWALSVLALMAPRRYTPFVVLASVGLLVIPMDYSSLVILLPLVIHRYWFEERRLWLALGGSVAVLSLIALFSNPDQWFALLALPLIFLLEKYDRRVRLNKWLFYVFYPAHILLLWGVVQLIP